MAGKHRDSTAFNFLAIAEVCAAVVKDSMQQQLYVLVLYLGPPVQVIQRLTILDGQ